MSLQPAFEVTWAERDADDSVVTESPSYLMAENDVSSFTLGVQLRLAELARHIVDIRPVNARRRRSN